MTQTLNVLVVEDDEEWLEIYKRAVLKMGWKPYTFDRIDPAIQVVRQGDIQFFAAIVDKGGSGIYTGEPDLFGHRDGLRVLQELLVNQPDCIRALGTAEPYQPGAFDQPELGVQIFFDKRRCNAKDLLLTMEGKTATDFTGEPFIIPRDNGDRHFRGRERD